MSSSSKQKENPVVQEAVRLTSQDFKSEKGEKGILPMRLATALNEIQELVAAAYAVGYRGGYEAASR